VAEEKEKQSLAEERARLDDEWSKLEDSKNELAQQRTEWAEQRTEYANQRTEWAQHRTALASERTFIAWLRTGMSAIAGGIAVAELLGEADMQGIARTVGITLVLLGMIMCAAALWRFLQVRQVLERENLPTLPTWVAVVMVVGLFLVTGLIFIIIFFQ
jgi:putative membrane protein